MPDNSVCGVIVKRFGRTWRVQLEKPISAGFVTVATVREGLKLAEARAEAARLAAGYGTEVREVR